MFCNQCGAPLDPDARFCQACGAPASEDTQVPSPEDEKTATPRDDAPSSADEPAPQGEDAPARRRMRPAAIAGIAVAGTLLVGAGVFAAMQLAPSSDPTTIETNNPSKDDTGKDEADDGANTAPDDVDNGAKTDASSPSAATKALIDQAKAQGLPVYTGTVRIFETDAQLAEFQGRTDILPYIGSEGGPYAILDLGAPVEIDAYSGDGQSHGIETMQLIGLGNGRSDTAEPWRAFDGQQVSVTWKAVYMPSDVSLPTTGRATDARALDERWSAGAGAGAGGASSSAPAESADSDSYVLPNSATRVYSISELSGLSSWQLMIARNEIYARHGRGFNDAEVRSYFQNQSWYQQRYTAEEFDAMANTILSSIEQQNIANILEVEG